MDLLLDNIMVYWLTGTAGTATWLYRGVTEQQNRALPEGKRVETPTGFAAFPADLAPPPPRDDHPRRIGRRCRSHSLCRFSSGD